MAVGQARGMVTSLGAAGFAVKGAEVLEIGSGWVPTLGTVFAASGARQIVLTDVTRLMDEHTLELARLNVAANAPDLVIPDRMPFEYRAPIDLSEISSESADLIVSRSVLEHVPGPKLPALFANCRRILRRTGAMCHIIDHTDHRAHTDPHLSFLDFMRYPPGQWAVIDWLCGFHQNRLRSSDFPPMIEAAGFQILSYETHTHPTRATNVPFAAEFDRYDPKDRRVSISTVIAK